MDWIRSNVRLIMALSVAATIALLVALVMLLPNGETATGAAPYDLSGVSEILFTVPEIPGLAPEIHAVCLAHAVQTDVPGSADGVTLRAMCYQTSKTGPGTPPAPPPPPPPFESADHRVLTGTVADATNGAVQLTLQGCLAPLPVSNPTPEGTPTPSGLEVLLIAKADKSGWLADGSDSVLLKLDQTLPLTCTDGSETSNTFTPTNLAADHNDDGDGCTDAQELGTMPTAGGLRDPWNFWDFYDTPVIKVTNTNGVINIGDVTRVIARFGASDNGGAASPNRDDDPTTTALNTAPAYHPAFDRGASLGPNPWNLKPADGVVNIGDVTRVIAQFNTVCA